MTFRRGAVVFSALLCACPPAPIADAGVDAGSGLSIIDTCDLLSAAKCDLISRCYAAFSRNGADDCRALQQASCLAEYDTLRASFEADRVAIDSKQVLSCKARMEGSACPPSFPPGYVNVANHPFADCELQTGLLTGQVHSGQTCALAIDCAPGTVCVKQGGTCLGVCSSSADVGAPCSSGCAAGLRCDDRGTEGTADDVCAVLEGLNDPCAASVECEAQLVCRGGTCRPRSKLGEACLFDPDRLSTCEPGLACDVTPFVANQIGSCVVPRGLFEKCRFHWSCEPGLVCADLIFTGFPAMAPMDEGSCRAPNELDTNCPSTPYAIYLGDQCVAGTSCNQTMNKCLVAPRLGETCSAAAQDCVGVNTYCKPVSGDQGTCTGPSGQGDRCAFSIDATNTVQIPCSSGWCDSTSTQQCRAPFRQLNAECKVDGECLSGRCAVQQDRSLKCAEACN